MNAPLKALAEGIDVRLGAEIAEVEREESGWRLILSDGTMLPVFDRVISTIPAPQAQQVYAAFPSVTEPLSAVKMAPCWTVMLAFEEPVDPGFDLACNPTPLLSLLVRNSSKPGRAIDQHCWVAHARAAWSRECLEMRADEVLPLLLNEVGGAFGRRLPSVLYAAAHRWRYARTETPLGRPFLSMANGTLLLGGDWALGPDISHAIESGAAMARAILEELRTCLV